MFNSRDRWSNYSGHPQMTKPDKLTQQRSELESGRAFVVATAYSVLRSNQTTDKQRAGLLTKKDMITR